MEASVDPGPGGVPPASGVGVLDKAARILEALGAGPAGLGALSAETGLPRATTHRLAVALEVHGLVERDDAGRFVLGTRLAELGRAAGPGRRTLAELGLPALRALRDRTSESVQLYVVSATGTQRVCVVALESPHSLRTIVDVGTALPMDRGSAAAALAGERLGRAGWVQTVEERERGVASVSAPVRAGGRIVAAVSVSGPLERTTRQPGRRYGADVVAAAREIEQVLRPAGAA